jgi:hypothetical protein
VYIWRNPGLERCYIDYSSFAALVHWKLAPAAI